MAEQDFKVRAEATDDVEELKAIYAEHHEEFSKKSDRIGQIDEEIRKLHDEKKLLFVETSHTDRDIKYIIRDKISAIILGIEEEGG